MDPVAIQERMEVSGLEAHLKQSGMPLEEGVDRMLIEIMAEEKETFTFTSDLADDTNYDLSSKRFSDDNITRFEQDMEKLHTNIAQRVSEILSLEQFEAFMQNQKQMRELQISQIKMAANMFGGEE